MATWPRALAWKVPVKERTKLLIMLAVFAACWFLPVGSERFMTAVGEGLTLLKWYAQEHVLLCLVPAFFIAGAISVFVSQGSVMKYLGPAASKFVAYPVAAVSGTILAVCSCTVLPLFASIHKRGAGLGPATAFLYSGPAINALAIILTARVLGIELGIARAVGAVAFSMVIGLFMHLFFRKEEEARQGEGVVVMTEEETGRKLWQNGVYFAAMVGILVFANWGKPAEGDAGVRVCGCARGGLSARRSRGRTRRYPQRVGQLHGGRQLAWRQPVRVGLVVVLSTFAGLLCGAVF